jgi:outer membrane protein assembly factor BamB
MSSVSGPVIDLQLASDTIFAKTGTKLHAVDAQTGKELWSFTNSGLLYSNMTIADNVVYITNEDGDFFALDSASGTELWKFSSPNNGINAAPVIGSGTAYVGGSDTNLYAIDTSTGKQKWTFQAEASFEYPAILVNNTVYVADTGAYLYAVGSKDGQFLWQFREYGSPFGPLVEANGIVYLGGQILYALDEKTGQKKWQFSANQLGIPTPVVIGGGVYLAVYDAFDISNWKNNGIYALDEASGHERWYFSLPNPTTAPYLVPSPLVVTNEAVFVRDLDLVSLYCLDASTGHQRWKSSTYEVITEPVLAGNLMLFGSKDGNLYAVNPSTGQHVWTYSTDGAVGAAPVTSNGVAYVANSAGILYAIQLT